jgi:hypothetical protein
MIDKINMGWYDYYNLLKKYNGDLNKATKEEMQYAFLAWLYLLLTKIYTHAKLLVIEYAQKPDT